jgi:hypothetical protein
MLSNLKIYATPDDLPDHLSGFVRRHPGGLFTTFNHPFLVDIFPIALTEEIDDLLEAREQYAEDSLAKGSLSGYIFAHQRPYRLGELISLGKHQIDTKDKRSCVKFWKLAASVWMDAEEDESHPLWEALLNSPVPYRDAMTSSHDRRLLRSFLDPITVFRGIQAADHDAAKETARRGYSWTTSRRVAEFFSQRFLEGGDLPWIAMAKVNPSQAIAYLSNRNEHEILLDSAQIDPQEINVVNGCGDPKDESQYQDLRSFFANFSE